MNEIRLSDLASYLTSQAWSRLEQPNPRLQVFTGPEDDRGNPIRVVLPVDDGFSDAISAKARALDLISAVYGVPVRRLIETINAIKSDFLNIGTLIGRPRGSLLSLNRAVEAVVNIRKQVVAAACCESSPRPYYRKANKRATQAADNCSFGHTFQGSFGFSVESPMAQMQLGVMERVTPPFNRRVMERIMRGVHHACEAAVRDDVSIITNNFETGLNANFIDTLLKLLDDVGGQFEYSVAWSSALIVSEDLRKKPSALITSRLTPYLREASIVMRRTEWEEYKSITGLVRMWQDDSRVPGQEADHIVKIFCTDDDFHKKTVRAHLSTSQFKLACDAIKDTFPVKLSGKIEKINGVYYMYDPDVFEVVGLNEVSR